MQNICVPHKTIFPLIFKFLPPFHFEILFNLSVLILSIAFTETETGCEYDVSKQPDLLTGEDPKGRGRKNVRKCEIDEKVSTAGTINPETTVGAAGQNLVEIALKDVGKIIFFCTIENKLQNVKELLSQGVRLVDINWQNKVCSAKKMSNRRCQIEL